MKVSEKWLRELVNPALDIEAIAEKLTFAGVELDSLDAVASDFSNVVVGQVKSVEPHPDADRLRVCQVDVGADELIQIVTNVASVEVGRKVPVAMIGARLPEPDGSIFKIKKSKLRGVISQGMFCGPETLGIELETEGLLPVPQEAALGADLREVMALDDKVMELDITPNRADCLSMIGVAREVGVLTDTDVQFPVQPPIAASIDDTFPVHISAVEGCKRYAGRVIRNVNPQAATPEWMVTRLQRAGIRSLSSIVDITNYVLIELGQPMHAFDLDKLQSGIDVRMAGQGETLELLDGGGAELNGDTLVIADGNGPIAMAGIMGGMPTSVTDKTRHIFLESAFFAPEMIAGKARSYGLHTDSSHRFERGVPPDLQQRAIERATQLVLDICGGEAGPVVDLIKDDQLLDRPPIHLHEERIEKVLGVKIPGGKVESILNRLGCEAASVDDGWQVVPPVFRFDMAIEVDLIEELARINGYDQIPAVLRKMAPLMVQSSEAAVKPESLYKVLTARGYQEVVSYSFVDEETEILLTPDLQAVKLANPLSAELAVMRTTLWSGLIKTALHNLKRQQDRVRIFETGLTFVQTHEGLVQRKKIAGLISGTVSQAQWGEKPRKADFFDIKGDVEALLAENAGIHFDFEPGAHSALHPGQCARIVKDGVTTGWLGALHPGLEKALDIGQEVYLFELDMDMVSCRQIPAYSKVSAYPAIQRDLALLVEENVSYAEIERVIKKAEIVQLVDYHLFDSYAGEGIPQGKKSLALSLIFQDVSRTLEETEIAECINTLVNLLEQETGGALRN